MKLKKINYLVVGIFVFILSLMIFKIAIADIVYLKNGDKISGDVVLKDGMISIKPPYCEKILINFREIEKIDIDRFKDTEELSLIQDDVLKNVLSQKINESDYPNAGHIYLYLENKYTYNDDNTLTIRSRSIIKVLKERSLVAANFVKSFKKDNENIKIIHARSISEDGIVANLKKDAIKFTDKYLAYPLYDKVKILQFSVPKVKIGSIIDVETLTKTEKIDILKPMVFRQYFINEEPIKHFKFTVEFPRKFEKDILYKKYFINSNSTDDVEIKQIKQDDTIAYTFEKLNILDYIDEPLMPPLSYFAPNVKFIHKFNIKDIANELKNRIETKIQLTPKLKEEVLKIIKDKKNKKAKAKAIYEFLATNIKNVNVYDSINNYYPIDLEKIYNEKYASLFDQSVLLYAFLKEAGLKCDICFGTNQNDVKFDEEMATIYDFDNILIECEDEYLYADSEFYPYGIIPEEYKDNKYFKVFNYNGLFEISRKQFEQTYSENLLNCEVANNGKSIFQLINTVYGSSDPEFRASYKYLKPIKRKQAFEELASKISNGGSLTNYMLSDVENFDEKQKYILNFESNNYVSTLGDMYMLIPIPFSSIYTGFVAKENRKFDIFFKDFNFDSTSVIIKLPSNYKVKYIPESIDLSNEYYRILMKLNYNEKENIIIFTRKTQKLQKIIPVSEFKKIKSMFELAGTLKKERIILEKAR